MRSVTKIQYSHVGAQFVAPYSCISVTYNPAKHHRCSIRLREYDYSRQGAYFITLCTPDYLPLFGKIIDGIMILNDVGRIIETTWYSLSKNNIELDAFVVMPNHIHGIIVPGNQALGVINHAPTFLAGAANLVGAQFIAPKTLGNHVREFKARCTHQIRKTSNDPSTVVWQRNYYEHIIRNDRSLEKIRRYITNNPVNWKDDEMFV